jgi:formylmethanofuran dehydrogenase subunit C
MDRRAMKDMKPLSIIVAKKERKLEVYEIARQNLEKEIADLKLILGNKSVLLGNLNQIAQGRDDIATLKSQCEKDTLNSSREGDITMDGRIEELRGEIQSAQKIRKND